ncbi:twin-arginine translocase subunit TatC [Ferrimicrobium sp.]|uniref:twin-arginine translocase subunit TatC n=1 Tax=Ferrimicrobium sp. TaxID=2926050 RepID=UPI00263617C0|nr:twin-arginine translocase subunit TatC [Ferrimicrobium sp.]
MVEHLRELRKRLIISIVAVSIGAVVGYIVYPSILTFLMHPLCVTNGADNCSLYVTGPFDGFAIRLKVAAISGVFFASPIILWQLWRFIAPGLRSKERRYGLSFVLSSLLLFALGAAVAYLVFPHALHFFESAAGAHVHAIYTPQNYLNFLMLLMIAFGISFLFPLVLIVLELLGAVSPTALRKRRRYAWLGIIVVVAVFIPSNDPYSLTAMTVPLLLFYELAILVGRILLRPASKSARQET